MATNDNPHTLMLAPNDLVGVIRQGLGEVQGYLSQPMQGVDAAVVVAYLDRMGDFARHLLDMQNAQHVPKADGKGDGAAARKN